MKSGSPVEEKLHQSAKAVTIILTSCIVLGALVLFFTHPNNDLFLSVVVPAAALLTIPIIWIMYYFILTVCKIAEYVSALNENFVTYAKSNRNKDTNK